VTNRSPASPYHCVCTPDTTRAGPGVGVTGRKLPKALPFRVDPSPRVGPGATHVLNGRETGSTVEITVLRDGDRTQDRAHTLDGTEGHTVGEVETDGPWMGEEGSHGITVTARVPPSQQ
jgi:hypothetical protein